LYIKEKKRGKNRGEGKWLSFNQQLHKRKCDNQMKGNSKSGIGKKLNETERGGNGESSLTQPAVRFLKEIREAFLAKGGGA